METCITESIAPARRVYLIFAACIAGLAILATLTALVRGGISHVWAPLGAFPVLAMLVGLTEMHLRSKMKRKLILRDEGLILTRTSNTETILWHQIKRTSKCLSGLSVTYEIPEDAEHGIRGEQRTKLLYMDGRQSQELLAVVLTHTHK